MRARNVSDYGIMFILAVAVGVAAGVCAAILKSSIAAVTSWLTSGLRLAGANWQLLVIPAAGIVLTGILLRYVLRVDVTHGTEKILRQLKAHDYFIRAKVIVAPMLGAIVTLGMGGSAGAEGPIAYTGGAIGSNSARLFGLNRNLERVLLGCGAAAGIAGIFKSPLGGFLFALEVLRIKTTTWSTVALLTASLTAAATAYVLSGFTFDLGAGGVHLYRPDLFGWYCLLGVTCGLYSYYYSHVMSLMSRRYGKISNPWLRNLAGGAVLAACLFIFPVLYGEGYEVMGRVMDNDSYSIGNGSMFEGLSHTWQLALVATGVWLAKPWACSASNSAGGVAGDFAPTLFAGCFVGLTFSLVLGNLGIPLPEADFAYLGMGAVMAGAIRAPLMALFISLEMAACFAMFWPMLIVTSLSFFVVRLCTPHAFYSLKSQPKDFPDGSV